MKNKTTAAVLAFFLGGIGGHRFYLGQTGLGIIYLIFCWTFIPAFIALIDFIIFLTMSEDNFNMKYNRFYLSLQQQPNIIINNTNNNGQSTPSNQATSDSQENASQNQKLPKKDPFESAADEKYENYDFDGAIKDYLRSLNLRSSNPEIHFKLGCLYSILEQKENAFFHISKAVEKGFYDLEKIRQHDHLAYLRSQPQYDNFVNNGYKLSGVIAAPTDNGLDLSDAVITKIEKLAKMKDQGIINELEFETQKAKLLSH